MDKRRKILEGKAKDKTVLNYIDKVAFNQDELNKLVAKKEPVIYLCDVDSADFVVSLANKNIIYIGIGDVNVVVNDENIDDTDLNVFLISIMFDSTKYKALSDYEKLLDCRNATVLYYIAESYFYGISVSQDYKKAEMWYSKAAKLEHGQSMYSLGYMYMTGKNENMVIDEDVTEKYFEQAERLGAIDDELKKRYLNKIKNRKMQN